ncbi:hypothetical protein [Sphingomonas koreensis]
MRNALNHHAAEAFHDAVQPQAPRRLFCYVEAIAACGLLIYAGISLLGPWA